MRVQCQNEGCDTRSSLREWRSQAEQNQRPGARFASLNCEWHTNPRSNAHPPTSYARSVTPSLNQPETDGASSSFALWRSRDARGPTVRTLARIHRDCLQIRAVELFEPARRFGKVKALAPKRLCTTVLMGLLYASGTSLRKRQHSLDNAHLGSIQKSCSSPFD